MPFDQHLTFPSTTTNLLFLSMTSAFFLDSTYQWTHSAFVFVWLISLGIMSSRSISVVPNIRIVVCQAPLFMGFSRQENWSGLPCSPSRGYSQPMDKPRSPTLQGILYCLSHQGSPRILEWVAYPFSRGSSWPRNRTRVFCIAGRLFTTWATRACVCVCVCVCIYLPHLLHRSSVDGHMFTHLGYCE